jgi:hypothetical protein
MPHDGVGFRQSTEIAYSGKRIAYIIRYINNFLNNINKNNGHLY